MRNWIVLSLILTLAAGCASVSATSTISSENQEEQIQKLLIGTWVGNIGDTPWYRVINSGVMLQISGIRREKQNWIVDATINRRQPEYATIAVYNGAVRLEMMARYGGLFTLDLYRDGYLVGNVIYDRGRWLVDPHNVVLRKIR